MGISDELRNVIENAVATDFPTEDPAEVLGSLDEGDAVLVGDKNGFAVVHKPDTPDQTLWILWVAPEHRGRNLGPQLVKEVLERFNAHQTTLKCVAELRPRHGRLGFVV